MNFSDNIWTIVVICYGIIAAVVGGVNTVRYGDEVEAVMIGVLWPCFLIIYPFHKLYHFSAKCYRNRKRRK